MNKKIAALIKTVADELEAEWQKVQHGWGVSNGR